MYTDFMFIDPDTDISRYVESGGSVVEAPTTFFPLMINVNKGSSSSGYGVIVPFEIPDGYNFVDVCAPNYQNDDKELGVSTLTPTSVVGSLVRLEGNTAWVRITFVGTANSFTVMSRRNTDNKPTSSVRVLVGR